MLHPKRGEVWLVDLGLTAKVRPCLVLSIPIHDEDRALITVIAHTTSSRGTKFEAEVKVKFFTPWCIRCTKFSYSSSNKID